MLPNVKTLIGTLSIILGSFHSVPHHGSIFIIVGGFVTIIVNDLKTLKSSPVGNVPNDIATAKLVATLLRHDPAKALADVIGAVDPTKVGG